MKARQAAIASLMKYLHKSEAGRFAPKESVEPKAEEAKEGSNDMAPEMMEALQALVNGKGE